VLQVYFLQAKKVLRVFGSKVVRCYINEFLFKSVRLAFKMKIVCDIIV